MKDLHRNYDPKKMTWNKDDRTFFEEKIDTVYKRVAEVVIAQNERFFTELHNHDLKFDEVSSKIDNHEGRILKLERKVLIKKVRKAAVIIGIIALSLLSLGFLILK